MTLIVVGVSHKTAPVALREKLAFTEAELPQALKELLVSTEQVSEAVIVSTCNRTEVYASATTAPLGVETVRRFIRDYRHLDDDEVAELQGCLYTKQGQAMVEHLFRVVTSLDSLVLGEAQIIGQIRRAYMTASASHATGELFNHLFRQALEVGKRARSDTDIGAQSVSVSTVAVGLAERIFGSLEQTRVLVIGAGEMAELTLGYLVEKGSTHVTVANRTLEHARALAEGVGGQAIGFDRLQDALVQADIVISSTGSKDYVVDAATIDEVERMRDGRPILLVDIALPRDIDPGCMAIDGVYRYDLDDLGSIIDEHKQEREDEAAKVEELVEEETDAFLLWMQEREVTPTIKELYGKAENVCARELEHAERELAHAQGHPVSEAQRDVLQSFANAVSKKLLHGPTVRLRKQMGNPDAYLYTESARFLFGLDNNPLGLPCMHDLGQRCRIDRGDFCALAKQGTCPHGRSIR